MCDGCKEPVKVHEFGLTKDAFRCVSCAQYDFSGRSCKMF